MVNGRSNVDILLDKAANILKTWDLNDGQEIDINSQPPEDQINRTAKPPRIHVNFTEKHLSLLWSNWKNCLIIRLLGRNIGYKALKDQVTRMWDLQGDFEMVDMAMGFYLIKFNAIGDCERVYSRGRWIIMNHYLTIRRCDHGFKPEEAKEVLTAVYRAL